MLFKREPRRRFPYQPIRYKPPEEREPEDLRSRLKIRRIIVHEKSNNLVILLALMIGVILLIAYFYPEIFAGFRNPEQFQLDSLNIVP